MYIHCMCVYSFDFRFVNLHIWQVIENAAFLLPFPAAAQAAFHVIFSVAAATAATAHTHSLKFIVGYPEYSRVRGNLKTNLHLTSFSLG